MGAAGPSGPGGLQSEINVTPLVDVVLVLLILFMVIVPLTLRSYHVEVPGEQNTEAAASEERPPQIVLSIDPATCPATQQPASAGLPQGCQVLVNDEPLPVTSLAERMTEIFTERSPKDRVLFLAAHDQLNYEAVMRIVDAARSDVEDLRIGLMTRSL